jgi:hypothetical protein
LSCTLQRSLSYCTYKVFSVCYVSTSRCVVSDLLPCSCSYRLATVSQLTHCSNCPTYNISARNAQKTPFLCFCLQLSCKHACLRSRYSVTAVLFLLISLSLSSNASTCHNIFSCQSGYRRVCIGNRIYWTLLTHNSRLHLQITIAQRLVFSVTGFTPLLGSGFQRRTFPFLWVPELSPASATAAVG